MEKKLFAVVVITKQQEAYTFYCWANNEKQCVAYAEVKYKPLRIKEIKATETADLTRFVYEEFPDGSLAIIDEKK